MAYSSNKEHPWFEICHPRPSAKWQVFIFPAAGTADLDKSFIMMTDAELVENLKHISDPKSAEVFDYKPFVDMMIPILRADAKIGDVLIPSNPINIPIIVYSGEKEEDLSEEFLNRWIELTTVKDLFRVRIFPGHHNFHSEHSDQVLHCLKEDFNQIIMFTKV
ncbi:unnamed protein product [Adineta ricciae]|uniref:Uncharacterized protein n=1 Tax=Adineta ricciae TaxID=249248 RepID=A0A813U7P3_ADIRI|nr:unnamed protein product [Adineta ricciae]